MLQDTKLVDEILASFRQRLLQAGEQLHTSVTPVEFHDAELEVHNLARELADQYTVSILQQMMLSKAREEAAIQEIRDRADAARVMMLVQRRRDTPVQLLGGTTVRLQTVYMCAKAPGAAREHRGKAGTGVYPVLDQLGISDRATPALRLRVCHASAEANSFDAARELLAQGGLKLSHRICLRLTYATADLALAHRAAAVKATKEGVSDGAFVGRRVVACVDGGRLQTRTARPGRPPKGGRRKFDRDWREPKVLTVYVLEENGRRDRRVAPIIDATLGDADAVFALLLFHLRRTGAHLASHVTFVADGGSWIWPRLEQLWADLGIEPDRRTEVVDYFHVVERLYAFARSRKGWTEAKSNKWVAVQKRRLKRGWVSRIVEAIRTLMTKEEAAKASTLGYWRKHHERLQYERFRALGVPCGSGAVESAVRRVVNMRMKSASTVWKERSAEGLLLLRAHAKSGRWNELVQNVLIQNRWVPQARRAIRAPTDKDG